MIRAMLHRITRIPPGPHFMPCGNEYAYELIADGKVIARTRYSVERHRAHAAAFALAKRRGITIAGFLV